MSGKWWQPGALIGKLSMRRKGTEGIMLSVVERLIACLERETADLAKGGVNETREHVATKSRLLFDLNRAIRETGDAPLAPAVAERLTVLRAALDRNASAIRANMAAMRELVGIVQASAARENTDGTYNRPAG